MIKKIRMETFLPPFLLIILCILFNLIDSERFASSMTSIYDLILEHMGWLFLLVPVLCLLVCGFMLVTKIGNVKIGGESAVPLFSFRQWFTIVLCTTIASGIVFWAAAEPVQHYLYPPVSKGILPETSESAVFAMTAVFNNWTILPYAIYTSLTVVFAFCYYNMKQKFSLGSCIVPLTKGRHQKKFDTLIDIVCIFALVAGLAASLGIGVMNIAGGFGKLSGLPSNQSMWSIIMLIVVAVFVLSAVTGITKGIKKLSNINFYFYILFLAIVLIFGGASFIFNFGMESIGMWFDNFFETAMSTGAAAKDGWAKNWPIFYFGNWAAWAPITAVFLGRISYGRRIKEVVFMNLVLPSCFSLIWFICIGGATMNLVLNNPSSGILDAYRQGYENVIYQLFENFPLAVFVIPIFIFILFISLVTACDSTTVSISSICTRKVDRENPDAPKGVKILWGVVIAIVAIIMMSIGEGLTGMKMLSNIGGLPAALFIIIVIICAFLLIKNPEKYNRIDCEQNNQAEGQPEKETNPKG